MKRRLLSILILIIGLLIFTILINSIKKSDNDIRRIAYNYLSGEEKKTIISWKEATVEEKKYTSDHGVVKGSKQKNIKNIDTYKVTFNTDMDGLLGPIIVYIDRKTFNILGVDLRD